MMIAAAPAQAQNAPVARTNPQPTAASSYWTAERFKAARPLPLPLATPGARHEMAPPAAAGRPASQDGQAPIEPPGFSGQQLFSPDAPAPGVTGVDPGARGTFGADYTSTRVFPLFNGAAAPYSADRAYPYRTVGILFFTIDNVPYLCSASVIQHRIVATAGHCVHSGTAAGFYDNWVFVPAYRDGAAPFKTWNWRMVATTGTWAGGGSVPNGADHAMIEFADQPMYPNAKPSKLGYVTGWLGWQTLNLMPNHTSKLGYPCNLDKCGKMQNVTSGSFAAVAPNNVEYGSDARGGPWVQNFQTHAVGGGTGIKAAPNRLVGVPPTATSAKTRKCRAPRSRTTAGSAC